MDAVWFGMKIGAGIVIGAVVAIIVIREINDLIITRKFLRAGFTWEENSNVRGWLTRDPVNDDWLLWDTDHGRTLRSSDHDSHWRVSAENRDRCLEIGRRYQSAFENTPAATNDGSSRSTCNNPDE